MEKIKSIIDEHAYKRYANGVALNLLTLRVQKKEFQQKLHFKRMASIVRTSWLPFALGFVILLNKIRLGLTQQQNNSLLMAMIHIPELLVALLYLVLSKTRWRN